MAEPVLTSYSRDRWAAAMGLIALLLGLLSYFWAEWYPEYPWDGPLLLLAAVALLVMGMRRTRPQAAPTAGEKERSLFSLSNVSPWRLVAFAGSLLATLFLLARLVDLDRPDYSLAFFLWLTAIVLFVLAVAPPVSRPREDWSLWWEVNRRTVMILSAIMLVALVLRLWNLAGIPANLGGDEGAQGLEALRVLEGEVRNPFSTGWLGVPTMSFFFNSISIYLFDATIFALRLPWSLVGTFAVLVTFWLVTRLRGLPLGLVTAALLATYHYHIHFSRLGSNQIADPFFIALALLFLYRARDRNSPFDWALAGIVAGLGQYFYAGARLAIVVLAACLLLFFWENRERRDVLRNLVGGSLTLLGGLLITAAPMIQYALRFPDEYNARLNSVGIIQSGWLWEEPAIRGVSMLAVLWDQFVRAFFAFNLFPDRTVWYGSPEPLMDGVWGTLFLLGLLFATIRFCLPNTDRRYFPMLAWWWSGMVLGGMLTESPPSSQRLVTLAPPACFFVALMLLRSLQFLQEAWSNQRNLREIAPALLVAVLLLSGLSVHWYFYEFTPLNVYGSRNGAIATKMAKLLPDRMADHQTVVFVGPPFIYLDFGTIPYLAPEVAAGVDVQEPLTAPVTLSQFDLPPGQRPLFVVVPPRADELDLIRAGFPGGTQEVIYDQDGEPLFWIYEP